MKNAIQFEVFAFRFEGIGFFNGRQKFRDFYENIFALSIAVVRL
jgi:hypothetical protein